MRRIGSVALALALAANAVSSAWAADAPPAAEAHKEARADKVAEQIDAATARPPVNEVAKTTAHQVVIRGQTIRYQATAGTLTLRDADGKPTASIFYVAYTAGDKPDPRRPVTFLYNGGPGSSSLWLHMGSLGPVRVETDSPLPTHTAPYTVRANDDSLLDKSDLVFIDAPGTGYSRPLGDAKGKDFYGVDQDIDAFSKAIIRYITLNNRWNSPKFLFGESYGTTRSAALSNHLQEEGVTLNGVVLLSSILNYGIRQPGYDDIYETYLPSYAAAAWYHNRLANRPADLPAFLAQVREFAHGAYAAALNKGQDITPAEEDAVARQMSAYTGLSVEFIKNAKLRVDLFRFQKELLRDQHKTLGRFDARFTGVDADAAGERPEYDASDTAVSGAFIAALHSYLTGELGYQTDLDYRVAADGAIQNWDWHHKFGRGQTMNNPDVALDLSAAMRQNPHLKLLSMNGYYDMATPFFGTEHDIGHMMLEPEQRKNVTFTYYPSGHMVYLNPEALKQMVKDLDSFYDQAR